MGSRAAVDQTLSRLAKDGLLIRVDRGAYAVPLKGHKASSAKKVIESLATLSGELIVLDGAASAAALGLVEHAPIAPSYITSGRSRALVLSQDEVILNHAPSWMLAMGDSPAGMAVRAVAWLGPDKAGKTLAKIRRKLSPPDWLMLVACRGALPSWMARAIGVEAAKDSGSRPRAHRRLAIQESSRRPESGIPNGDASSAVEIVVNHSAERPESRQPAR